MIVTRGDYINWGPDTRGVIEKLIDLVRKCRLIPILGNHDQMLLEARSGLHSTTWLGMGGIATLETYGPGRDLSLIPKEHFEFLEGCLDFHETETHVFVHANYLPDIPMDEQPVGMLRWESLRDMNPGPHDSGKRAIVGLTSRKGGEILDLGRLKCIDTYCHGGGWLTALEVVTTQVWQADREGGLRRR